MCPFCEQANINKQEIFHTNLVRVIQTHAPIIDPHVLIVPVRHIQVIDEASVEEVLAIHEAIKTVHEALKISHGIRGYNLLLNAGHEAGQEVEHLHVHFFGSTAENSGGLIERIHHTLIHGKAGIISDEEIAKRIEIVREGIKKSA